MLFTVLGFRQYPSYTLRSQAFLKQDDWNDFQFYTLYYLSYVDERGQQSSIGAIKIAYFGQPKSAEARKLSINDSFEKLEKDFFSLGQDDSYYDNLNKLGEEIRDEILISLRDIAKDKELYEKAINEDVTKESLLRSVSETSITGQFRRMTMGGARLLSYEFDFIPPIDVPPIEIAYPVTPVKLSFNVTPNSSPPTNIHVLIGRNGVGKTHLINNMINTLVKVDESPKYGTFQSNMIQEGEKLFANLVSVSFSAFDESEPIAEIKDKTSGIHYSYIGLKQIKDKDNSNLPPKTPDMLNKEFVNSAQICKIGSTTILWKKAIELLEADSNFKDADITSIIDIDDMLEFESNCLSLYASLSSGHKIVLLTITRLIESIEERSLILLDEPETHLHPPLLSAFIRALSDLLIHKNGVAIIATHSPVILQEVPKSCVYTLRKPGNEMIAERLEAESFGENVGSLTREVFGLEVSGSGFHKSILDVIETGLNYDSIIGYYGGQLGMEARSIIRARIASRDGLENNK